VKIHAAMTDVSYTDGHGWQSLEEENRKEYGIKDIKG
jgi:hypothetical protein